MEEIQEKLQIKKELPKGLVIGGFLAIILILALIPFITWLLEYKDTISAPLTIMTKTTPVDVFAKTSGELVLLVQNNGAVKKDSPLALIKNAADLEDIQTLKRQLRQLGKSELGIAKELTKLQNLNVGEVQPAFIQLLKEFENYQTFIKTDRHYSLVKSRQEQIDLYQKRKSILYKKSDFLSQDKAYAEKFAEIDKKLLKEEVIAARKYDESNRAKLGKEMADLDNQRLINGLDLEIKTLERERVEIRSLFHANKLQLINNTKDAFHLLENQLKNWELTYLLKANISGICVYKDYLNDYRYVEKEEKVFSIIPKKDSLYFGLLKLPMAGAGKVDTGQLVYVKLNNYPFMEFGILKGKVLNISPLPFDNRYNVQVVFPNGFVSSYGDTLKASQLMHGIAEVIVEKKSLYNRIADQVKSVRYNR